MRYEILNAQGTVENTIEADEAFVQAHYPGAFREAAVQIEAAPPATTVPQSVSRFQARAALHLAGYLSAVETLMTNEATPVLARLAWQDALTFERYSPTVLGMAQALGLDEAAIDQMFITAAQITA